MSILYGLKAIQGNAGSNLPFIFGFNTARSVANDDLLELWNGPTVAGIKFAVDKDGKAYSAALAAGDILYAVTGGIANVRRLDSLVIGGAATYLRSTGAVPAWATISATEITVGNLPYAQLPTNGAGGTWSTGGTLTLSGGRLVVLSSNDVSLAGVSGGLIVGGDGTAAHLALDPNEIMAKTDATTAGILGINADGGDVQIGGNRTVEATDLTFLLRCGDAAGANTRNVVLDWSMGATTRWRAGMTGSVNWRLFDVVNNLSVLTAAPSSSLIDVTLNSATTTGSVDGRFSINAGTNAGANNRDAMLEFRRGQTGLWREGVLGSVAANTSWTLRDIVNNANAIVITAGATPAVAFNGALSGITTIQMSGSLFMSQATTQLIPGATSFAIRDNANSNDNLLVANSGAVTVRNILTIAAGELVLNDAASQIIPGVTSMSLRNHADSADNLIITDAGNATVRGTLTSTGQIIASAGINLANAQAITFTGPNGSITLPANGALTVGSGGLACNGTLTMANNFSISFTGPNGSLALPANGLVTVNGTQVVSARRTGWTAWTGTAARGTQNADAPPTLTQVAQAFKALLDDLINHGLVGA